MARVYSNKALLKFQIFEAVRLKSESNRNPKLFCPLVEVSIVDDNNKRVEHCEFKTKRVSYIDKSATWNIYGMFAFVPEIGMKVVFKIKDDTDSLGVCMIPLEEIPVILEAEPMLYDLQNSGKIRIHIGWYGGRDDRSTGSGIDVPLTSRDPPPIFKKVVPELLDSTRTPASPRTPSLTPVIENDSVRTIPLRSPYSPDKEKILKYGSVRETKKGRSNIPFQEEIPKKEKTGSVRETVKSREKLSQSLFEEPGKRGRELLTGKEKAVLAEDKEKKRIKLKIKKGHAGS